MSKLKTTWTKKYDFDAVAIEAATCRQVAQQIEARERMGSKADVRRLIAAAVRLENLQAKTDTEILRARLLRSEVS